jgi:hypothetical protein
MKVVNTLPPKEIYDVLHEAEGKGIELPQSIEKWWKKETLINEVLKETELADLIYNDDEDDEEW